MNRSRIDSELYEILHFTPETSSEVQDKVNNAYEQIRSGKIQLNKKKKFRKILYAGAAASVILLIGFLGFSNPALAGKIPFIGRIFTMVENNVGYSGNYSDYAAEITAPENNTENNNDSQSNIKADNNSEDGAKFASYTSAYSQTSGDITITLSEVVCTDLSLYISLEIYNKEEFPEDFNMLKNMEEYKLSYNFLYLICQNYFDFAKDTDFFDPYLIEGDYADSHTFLAILRIDLDSVRETAGLDALPTEFTYTINISRVWGQLNEPEECEMTSQITGETRTIMSNHKRYNGEWNFTIPITMDQSGTQIKKIMETNEDGIGISDVIKTRYEIIAELILPDILPEGKEVSDYLVVITDANGEILDDQGGYIMGAYSIYGRNTDTVHIYIMDWRTFRGSGSQASLLEDALYQTTVTW